MTSQPNVTFSLKAWDEKPYNEVPGELKMTRSSVAYTDYGDIEGEIKLSGHAEGYPMIFRFTLGLNAGLDQTEAT